MGKEPLLPPFFQAVAVAFDVNRGAVVENPIQHRRSDHMVAEDLAPLAIGFVRGEVRPIIRSKNYPSLNIQNRKIFVLSANNLQYASR